MTAPGVTYDIPEEQGDALWYWMIKYDMTQEYVGRQIFVGQNQISKWATHKVRIPPDRLTQLADLFTDGDVKRFLAAGREP